MKAHSGRAARVARFENIAHYLTAFVVFLKGLDKFDLGKTGIGILFMTIGAFIVFGTLFHHKAEKWLRHFKAYVFLLESIVMAVVGYLYMKDGKQYIQYVCYATSVVFIVALIIYIRKVKPATH
jgi:hypothetical protein